MIKTHLQYSLEDICISISLIVFIYLICELLTCSLPLNIKDQFAKNETPTLKLKFYSNCDFLL